MKKIQIHNRKELLEYHRELRKSSSLFQREVARFSGTEGFCEQVCGQSPLSPPMADSFPSLVQRGALI